MSNTRTFAVRAFYLQGRSVADEENDDGVDLAYAEEFYRNPDSEPRNEDGKPRTIMQTVADVTVEIPVGAYDTEDDKYIAAAAKLLRYVKHSDVTKKTYSRLKRTGLLYSVLLTYEQAKKVGKEAWPRTKWPDNVEKVPFVFVYSQQPKTLQESLYLKRREVTRNDQKTLFEALEAAYRERHQALRDRQIVAGSSVLAGLGLGLYAYHKQGGKLPDFGKFLQASRKLSEAEKIKGGIRLKRRTRRIQLATRDAREARQGLIASGDFLGSRNRDVRIPGVPRRQAPTSQPPAWQPTRAQREAFQPTEVITVGGGRGAPPRPEARRPTTTQARPTQPRREVAETSSPWQPATVSQPAALDFSAFDADAGQQQPQPPPVLETPATGASLPPPTLETPAFGGGGSVGAGSTFGGADLSGLDFGGDL